MSDLEKVAPGSRQAKRQVWLERLKRFADSSVSLNAFCRKEGISAQAFYYWKRRLQALLPVDHPVPRLLPVRVLPAPTPVEVALPSGPVLRLNPGCDLDFVRSLVSALEGRSC
jgi:hypothetical protein